MKIYVAMIVDDATFEMIGAYNSLNEAELAQSSDFKRANVIYECTIGKSNEWCVIRNTRTEAMNKR